MSSKQVRDVLKSELSTSVPVAAPVMAAVGRSGHQAGALPSKEDDAAEAAQPQEGATAGNDRKHTLRGPAAASA